MFLGVDIGGTFTDLVLLDHDGELITTKALSTPGELEVGVFNAVQSAAEQKGMTGEQLLANVTAFGHGTTQATNAVIERTGARTGLLATRGFGDTLAIQRLMGFTAGVRSEEHTSELQSLRQLVCRLLLEKKNGQLMSPKGPHLIHMCRHD